MAKRISKELVEEFVKEQIALEKQQLKVAILKFKLRKLESKGYEHPLLNFEDNISYRPPWKKIVQELAAKYMTKGARSIFFNRTLKKRFPAAKGKKKIHILAPRYETFLESIKEQKKKYGLTPTSPNEHES